MMIVPVYNQVILPDSNIFFPLNRIKATGAPVPGANEKVMFLFQKKPEQRFSEDSFWPIGVVGYVSDTSVQGIIIIRTVQRVNVEMSSSGRITAFPSIFPDGLISMTLIRVRKR